MGNCGRKRVSHVGAASEKTVDGLSGNCASSEDDPDLTKRLETLLLASTLRDVSVHGKAGTALERKAKGEAREYADPGSMHMHIRTSASHPAN
jgi:hypothetical protein